MDELCDRVYHLVKLSYINQIFQKVKSEVEEHKNSSVRNIINHAEENVWINNIGNYRTEFDIFVIKMIQLILINIIGLKKNKLLLS